MLEPKVVIVLLNYSRWKDTVDCVESLKKCNYQSFEILIVDNSSPDQSAQKLKEAFPEIKIYRTERNLGYAGGMNFGIRYAMQLSPEYLLLINSDTIVEKDFVKNLVDALERHPDAAAASGTIYYYPDTNKIWYAGGTLQYWRASGFSRHHLPTNKQLANSNIQTVSFLSGCALIVRASIFRLVGLFDERFFMYLEDAEYCSRLAKHGFRLLYVDNAVLYHKVSHEGEQPLPMYYSVRNRLLFLKISARGIQQLIGFVYLFITLLLKMLWWRFTKPQLFIAAQQGMKDYFGRRFNEGRGPYLTGNACV